MNIREYQSTDCKALTELFYHTVHTVNAKDYTKEQLDVWATGKADIETWPVWGCSALQSHSPVSVDIHVCVCV